MTSLRNGRALVATVFLALAMIGLSACQDSGTRAAEPHLLELTNGARAASRLAPLAADARLADQARNHSEQMAAARTLFHTSDLAGTFRAAAIGWSRVGENVAVAGTVDEAQRLFMSSAAHRSNILGDYNTVGLGVARGRDGRLYITELFAKATSIAS